MKTLFWLLLLVAVWLLFGCAIVEGLKEAGEASGLGGRKPTAEEVCEYEKCP